MDIFFSRGNSSQGFHWLQVGRVHLIANIFKQHSLKSAYQLTVHLPMKMQVNGKGIIECIVLQWPIHQPSALNQRYWASLWNIIPDQWSCMSLTHTELYAMCSQCSPEQYHLPLPCRTNVWLVSKRISHPSTINRSIAKFLRMFSVSLTSSCIILWQTQTVLVFTLPCTRTTQLYGRTVEELSIFDQWIQVFSWSAMWVGAALLNQEGGKKRVFRTVNIFHQPTLICVWKETGLSFNSSFVG